MVGGAGNTSFTLGSRWPVEDEGLAGMILASGRPARKDDYSTMPGPVGAAVRDDRMASMVGVPIVVDGSIWGFMVAGGDAGRGRSRPTRRSSSRASPSSSRLRSRTATMRAELAASRARVIAAADEARRRIERDLHDGAQQQLVTLALGLRSAEGRVPAGLEDIRAEVGRFADRLTSVVEELREMSRGIHPAILTEGGLSPAVEALALRSPVPVKLNVRSERRLPDGVEVAAYYVVSEALTNAAKHADASRVQIDLHVEEETLRLSVCRRRAGRSRSERRLRSDRAQGSRRGPRRNDRRCEPAGKRNPARRRDPASRGSLSCIEFEATVARVEPGRPLERSSLQAACSSSASELSSRSRCSAVRSSARTRFGEMSRSVAVCSIVRSSPVMP